MGLFEANEEKKRDVRVLERTRAMGKLDKKDVEALLKALPDESNNLVVTNIDELNANDNPVHVARNLPVHEKPLRTNFEDLEFDADDSNRSFEQ